MGKIIYEVWVLGYNKDDMATDFDESLLETENPSIAIDYAEQLDSFDAIFHELGEDLKQFHHDGDYYEVRVEELHEETMFECCEDLIYSQFVYN